MRLLMSFCDEEDIPYEQERMGEDVHFFAN